MSRKVTSEAENMFDDDEDFDAAYRGTPSVDATDVEIDDAEPEAEEEAWSAAEEIAEEEDAEPADFSDDEEEREDDLVLAEADSDAEASNAASDDDEDAEVSAAKDIINRRSASMAKKAEEKKMTKAEMIREEIKRRKAAGDSLRARDIIATLEEEGVEVNASQVSVTLRSMGVAGSGGRGRPAGQKKDKATATAAAGTRGRPPKAQSEEMSRKTSRAVTEKPVRQKMAQPAGASDAFTEADLEATAAFVGAVGTADRGMTLLRIFSRLND